MSMDVTREETAFERIEAALESVRGWISSHRGTVELVDFDSVTGIVLVRLGGACDGCGAAVLTLKYGIERRLREAVPAVVAVEAI